MRLNAIGVTSSNIKRTIEFYELLGFKFQDHKDSDEHVETVPTEGSIRLMIDSESMIEGILGHKPKPSNHSAFAVEFDSAKEVDEAAKKVQDAGFEIVKEPWDAFWGQRYCIVKDPGGYMVDLYAKI